MLNQSLTAKRIFLNAGLVFVALLLFAAVMLGGLGLLTLYQPMSTSDFLILLAVSQTLVAIDNVISTKLTLRMWRPVRAWERGARDEASTIAACSPTTSPRWPRLRAPWS